MYVFCTLALITKKKIFFYIYLLQKCNITSYGKKKNNKKPLSLIFPFDIRNDRSFWRCLSYGNMRSDPLGNTNIYFAATVAAPAANPANPKSLWSSADPPLSHLGGPFRYVYRCAKQGRAIETIGLPRGSETADGASKEHLSETPRLCDANSRLQLIGTFFWLFVDSLCHWNTAAAAADVAVSVGIANNKCLDSSEKGWEVGWGGLSTKGLSLATCNVRSVAF